MSDGIGNTVGGLIGLAIAVDIASKVINKSQKRVKIRPLRITDKNRRRRW
jgi:hypothetical protein